MFECAYQEFDDNFVYTKWASWVASDTAAGYPEADGVITSCLEQFLSDSGFLNMLFHYSPDFHHFHRMHQPRECL
jgi:hypothetical protein